MVASGRIQYPYIGSVCGYGFKQGGVCRHFIKNEDTWYTVLWHLRCRMRFNSKSTRGVVVRRARYIFVQNRNGNWNVPYLYENDDQVILNWNWLDNDWNDNNPALRFATLFFLLLLARGVLFFQELSLPSAEHPADFIKPDRKRQILFIIK